MVLRRILGYTDTCLVSLGELITQHNLFQYRLNKFEMAIMAVFLFFPAAGKLFKPIARFNKVIEKVVMAGISKFFKIPVKAGVRVTANFTFYF
jgi:hypothetical protein